MDGISIKSIASSLSIIQKIIRFEETPSFALHLQGFHANQAQCYGRKHISEPLSDKRSPLAVLSPVWWLGLGMKNRLNSERSVILASHGLIEQNSSIVWQHHGLKSTVRQNTPCISYHSRE
jgi:hypothetical protein